MIEFSKGAVTRKECRAIRRSYAFHIDRHYLTDLGCICRVVVNGHTLEIYRTEGETALRLPRFGTVASFVLGAIVVPSPIYGEWWAERAITFTNLVLNGLG